MFSEYEYRNFPEKVRNHGFKEFKVHYQRNYVIEISLLITLARQGLFY